METGAATFTILTRQSAVRLKNGQWVMVYKATKMVIMPTYDPFQE